MPWRWRYFACVCRHVYVHVPFCVRRCSYCDFSIAVRKRIPAREYVDAVLQELKLLGTTDPGREPGESEDLGLETLYLGGGTPSLLPPDAISALLVLRLLHRRTQAHPGAGVCGRRGPGAQPPRGD